MRQLTRAVFLFAFTAIVGGSPVFGGIINLGASGWRVEWDASLDPYLDVNYVMQTNDAVFIQKGMELTDGPVGGVFSPMELTFRQVSWPAVANIVVDDEIIVNSTGSAWGGFRKRLSGDATFDPIATLDSGTGTPIGFNVEPFNEAAFSGDLQRLNVWDGSIAPAGIWFPGDGVHDGALWISAAPRENAPFHVFTLTDRPLPEPASLLLLLLGGGAVYLPTHPERHSRRVTN